MGISTPHRKYFLLWPLALLLCISSPVQAVESVQEVEVSEDIKLYAHLKTNQTQKPLDGPTHYFRPVLLSTYISSEDEPFLRTHKRYLLHCNLTFYE